MTSLLIDSFGSAQGSDTTNQQQSCPLKHCWIVDRSLYRIVVALGYVIAGGTKVKRRAESVATERIKWMRRTSLGAESFPCDKKSCRINWHMKPRRIN